MPTSVDARVRAAMSVVVSLVILVVGLAIVSAPNVLFAEVFDEGVQKAAIGWIGALIGYWLS